MLHGHPKSNGFAFVAFASPEPAGLRALFDRLGIPEIATSKCGALTLHRQRAITFLVDGAPEGFGAKFVQAHGPSAFALGFRVANALDALAWLVDQGATAIDQAAAPLPFPAIQGVGGSHLYLVDEEQEEAIFARSFEFRTDWQNLVRSNDTGLDSIDHLTHNLFSGGIGIWRRFYESLFGFREIRSFDIDGRLTGLLSTAMANSNGNIRIPLNEPKSDAGKLDQIQEFLSAYGGEGIQHIALSCRNIYQTVETLVARSVGMQETPQTYYAGLESRLPGHGEPLEALRRLGILLDGRTGIPNKRLLLQIFSKPAIGPIFFEFIQRKGDEGFGEGNFRALFESLELDQINRGVLKH